MLETPLDLSKARVLISNDDGVNAPGIKLLERVMKKVCKEVWVVAPETEQSGAGHSLSLRRPLRLRKVSARKFAVDGTPTDSVLLATKEVLKDAPPDLLLSGINLGANVGEDVTYSGTVSAAFEGTLMGIPSIALSQIYGRRHGVRWSTAENHVAETVRRLVSQPWQRNVLWNVNFPNRPYDEVQGLQITRQGKRKLGGRLAEGTDPRGEPFFWIAAQARQPSYPRGTDLNAVMNGYISATPLSLELSHRGMIARMRKALG
jgi:5'-nucleotidase